ncbi:OmpA family protein [Candidatus Rariloculus sp.]|uniref:OmpA family protein n=1 Tax=Candidatus Rariloculus sp. TaxID=3101265 RepID=UPI003D127A62
MTKQILILMLAAGLASPAWTAENNSAPKEESIGVGSGVVVGALAGGPVGAIIGAAMGGWLGDKFHRERSQMLEHERQFEQARLQVDALDGMLEASRRDLAQLRSEWRVAQSDYRDALQRALDTRIYFRTGESELNDEAGVRLSHIAGLVAELGDLSIVVEGHADARGAEDYNERLSSERAAAVRDTLVQAGVSPDRISWTAEGERYSTAEEQDLDAMALDRRVNLSILDQRTTNHVAQQ